MKKFIFALSSYLFVCSFAFAQQIILVQPSQVLSFDAHEVSGPSQQVVTVEFSLTQRIADAIDPTVEVVGQFYGLQCEVISLVKVGSFRFMGKERETYQAKISWSSDQEASSCDIEIAHRNFARAKIVLYIEEI